MTRNPRLKGATRLVIHEIGGLEACAVLTGLSVSQLGRCQNVNEPDFISITNALLLEAQTGVRPHITQAMAALGGHILVPLPPVNATATPWGARLASMVKEVGEALSGFGGSLADDGQVTAAEAARLLPEVDQALSELMALRAELERQTGLPAPRS